MMVLAPLGRYQAGTPHPDSLCLGHLNVRVGKFLHESCYGKLRFDNNFKLGHIMNQLKWCGNEGIGDA